MFKKLLVIIISLFFALSCFSSNLHAITLFERGLPTQNLNNDAGSDRSNVAWGFEGNYISGDDFINEDINAWIIDELTVWSTSDTSYELWLGKGSESDLSFVSDSYSRNMVNYNNGEKYQGSSGDFLDLYEITFDNLSYKVDSGETYNFGLVGETPLFLHASNADLSGSTQNGADNLYKWFNISGEYGNVIDSDGNGWDKSSDINVSISGAPVPEPTTILLFGTGLLGLAGLGRKKFFKRS